MMMMIGRRLTWVLSIGRGRVIAESVIISFDNFLLEFLSGKHIPLSHVFLKAIALHRTFFCTRTYIMDHMIKPWNGVDKSFDGQLYQQGINICHTLKGLVIHQNNHTSKYPHEYIS